MSSCETHIQCQCHSLSVPTSFINNFNSRQLIFQGPHKHATIADASKLPQAIPGLIRPDLGHRLKVRRQSVPATQSDSVHREGERVLPHSSN